MEVIVAITCLTVLGGFFLVKMPFATWRFEYKGHHIVVRNYMLRETVSVDGVVLSDTRVRGDSVSYAEHEIVVEGQPLRVWVGPEDWSVGCRVDDGSQIVFASASSPSLLKTAQARPEAPTHEDPRMAAARVLLTDITRVDRQAADDLEQALVAVLTAEHNAKQSAKAHEALGGSPEDSQGIVQRRSADVEEVLSTLRTLHHQILDVDIDSAPALTTARNAIARIGATLEVDQAERHQAKLRAAQSARSTKQ